MNPINKILRIVFITATTTVLVPVLLNATILFRDTFEDNPPWTPWSTNVSGAGEWATKSENADDDYASQLHGNRSLWLKDPNDTSYACAKHKFPSFGMIPNHPEYMVEFYFWFPGSGVEIENMYLYKPTKNSNPADIEIVLDSVEDIRIR